MVDWLGAQGIISKKRGRGEGRIEANVVEVGYQEHGACNYGNELKSSKGH